MVQSLYEQDRIQLDLPTAGKVITALDILQKDYFPGEQLDPKNEGHFNTFQLLVSVQQQDDTSYLERYDRGDVLNAQKRLENFQHMPIEKAKIVIRENAILDACLSAVPVAGPFLKEALNQSTKPREESAIGLQDLRKLGRLEEDSRTISIQHLISTAGYKLDLYGKKVLEESYAEHITRLYEKKDIDIAQLKEGLEQVQADVAQFEEGIAQIHEKFDKTDKTLEEIQRNEPPRLE